mmetsp:Transcript_48646/g.145297  ORF Transcript_48646/g.145297 Transcript_48646/m.145297 type:complete len:215 (-) Transcript_48646:40-684(-)
MKHSPQVGVRRASSKKQSRNVSLLTPESPKAFLPHLAARPGKEVLALPPPNASMAALSPAVHFPVWTVCLLTVFVLGTVELALLSRATFPAALLSRATFSAALPLEASLPLEAAFLSDFLPYILRSAGFFMSAWAVRRLSLSSTVGVLWMSRGPTTSKTSSACLSKSSGCPRPARTAPWTSASLSSRPRQSAGQRRQQRPRALRTRATVMSVGA